MNHIYRTIWNESAGTVTVVSEHAKRGGKKTSSGKSAVTRSGVALRSVSVAVALALGSNVYAAPTGGTVVAGDASITNTPGSTTINQSSQSAVLNWQSFDVGVTESVRFVQPDSSSVALNRVLGADPSSILGNLSANGKVFLINPNGVLFGASAQVNVGGLVASTRNIADSDFLAGRYIFSGDSDAGILNQGTINADGGYVTLLGANVSNQGVIAARLGSVALAAGDALTLDVAGDGLLNVTVNSGSVDALVQNGGLIQADGGQVLLTARSASTLLQSAVNNSGMIQAQTIENRNGTIRLLGDMQSGTVNVGGTLDASAPGGGDGGFIDTSAATVKVSDGARVTTAATQGLTGSWLIDPTDYTIAASGGDMTGAQLSSSLADTDITIQSMAGATEAAGDVNVNDTVTWSANRLTLNAQNNININTEMNASGTASLALEYGQAAVAAGNTSTVNVNAPVNLPAGNNFSTLQGLDGTVVNYTVITSLGAEGSVTGADLQGVNGDVDANYVLGGDIDATGTNAWNAGAGFAPLVRTIITTVYDPWGSYDDIEYFPFTGVFDGLGHTISNLTINRPSSGNVGLFGLTDTGSLIRNVGLIDSSVTGHSGVGALVGVNRALISNSYASGSVTGSAIIFGENSFGGMNVGGLVGDNYASISNSYAIGVVSGSGDNVGGLVGGNSASINHSYAEGSVAGSANIVGGLVGRNTAAISNSHSTASVQGFNWVGGLLGDNDNATLSSSSATGKVNGVNLVGGLVGNNRGAVSNSYATGNVSGTSYVGGLIGNNNGAVNFTYASGEAVGSSDGGGIVGRHNGGTIAGSYWNSTLNARGFGQAEQLPGATGLTSVQMQTAANFTAFNFTTTPGATGNNWVMVNVDGSLNNAGGEVGATRPMLASEYSTTITNAHQLQLMAMAPAASYILRADVDAGSTALIGGIATDVWGSSGFVPIGNSVTPFTGAFDGLGHVVRNLTIDRPTDDYVGLFGYADGSEVHNLGLLNADITGRNHVGSLFGAAVVGAATRNYATGHVSGQERVGGLIGYNNTMSISSSYATSDVTGASRVGGLMGETNGGTLSALNYASGDVVGSGNYVGGLVGYNGFGFQIQDSYATGSVTGANDVGGLVGFHYNGAIDTSYATGSVVGAGNVGGLVGSSGSGSISDSFWDSQTSGQVVSAGGTAKTTEEMQQQSTFIGWDFDSTWIGYDGHTNPLLRSLMTELTVTTNSATRSYDGSAWSGGAGVTYSTDPGGRLLGTLSYGGASQGAINAGAYAISGSGLYSNQQGYLIVYADGALTITPAILTATVVAPDKIYDGNTTANATLSSLTGLIGDETLGASVTASFNSKDVADANLVTVDSVTLADGENGGLASNYTIASGQTATASITAKALTATAVAIDKVYDGDTIATATLSALTGLIDSETLNASGTATFNSKDVVDANLVTINSVTLADGDNGGLASNYTLASGQTSAASITAKALTATAMATDKVYDGDTTATATLSALTGLVGTETIGATGTASFNSKDVLDANLVTVNSITLTDGANGGMASNYSLASGQTTVAHITPKSLAATVVAPDKVYDGDTTADATLNSLTGLIGDETIGASGTATFNSKDVLDANLVTVNSITLTDGVNGGVASNYSLTSGQTTVAHITPKSLAATVVAPDKVYDGDTTADATLNSVTGLMGDETIGASGTATFNSKDVADANLVTVNSVTLTDGVNGGMASNYTLESGQTVAAHITPRELTIAGQVAQDKEYDGTTTATLTGGALVGVVAGETVMLNEAGAFATADVGDAIAVTAADSLSGAAAANYTVIQPTGLVANITAPIDVDVPPVEALPSGYENVVGHVAANVQLPPGGVTAPVSPGSTSNVSIPSGQATYNLAGLNLTVVTRDVSLPSSGQSQDDFDDDK